MNNIIMIRVNGVITAEYKKQMRAELLKDIKEGLFIVDDTIKDVTLTRIDDLGIEEE